ANLLLSIMKRWSWYVQVGGILAFVFRTRLRHNWAGSRPRSISALRRLHGPNSSIESPAMSSPSPSSESPLLALRGVSRSFDGPNGPVYAVRDVSLCVEEGECVAIMGRSGSGKSTLLNLIAGLDTPTAGRLVLDGQEITRLGDAA